MHDDTTTRVHDADWAHYFKALQSSGAFQGGSAIGPGACARKTETPPKITAHLAGYIRISADDADHARALVAGNPVFEAGGTVEIRELPRTT
jgi:hypothetical protein